MHSNTQKRLQIAFFFSLFLIAGALLLFIFRFYLSPLVLAAAFAVVFYPLYQWLNARVISQSGIAAMLVVIIALTVVIVPTILFGDRVVQELGDIYVSFTSDNTSQEIIEHAVGVVERYIPSFNANDFLSSLNQYLRDSVGWLFKNIGIFFSSAAQLAGNIFLGLLAFFFLLRDGKKLRDALLTLSPLPEERNTIILEKLRHTINSTVRGNLIIAILQGLLTGIGLAVFGVPHAILWGVFAIFAAVIPMIGTAIVLLPSIAYLWLLGSTSSAIGLLIWGILVVGLFDNALRPYLIERGSNIHPLLVLLSILGGLASFGAIGFLLGPLILSFFMALFDIYPSIIDTTHHEEK